MDKDEVLIACSVPAQFVRANPKVRADAGKVAIVKGPIVYCLEEIDNGKNLSAIFIDTNQQMTVSYEADLMGGTETITLKGKRLDESLWPEHVLYSEQKLPFEEVYLKAVPYSSWGNRMPGEMVVWMKELF